MKSILCSLVRIYQRLISPLLGENCRFEPTCSHYTREAIMNWGVCKGVYRSMIRIVKCHPWHPGGYDPIEGKEKG